MYFQFAIESLQLRRQFAWNVKPVFWEKQEKYLKMWSAEIYPAYQALKQMKEGNVEIVQNIYSQDH